MPYIGTQPKDVRSFGKVQFDFTATQGQTAFTGADDDGKTLGFTEGQIQVYVNGILMDASDYTTSNTNTVTLVSAANLNDIITVVALQTDIPNSDYVPISGGTFTGNISGTTADFSGNVDVDGLIDASGVARNSNAIRVGASTAGTGYGFRIGSDGSNDPLEIWRDHTNGNQKQFSVDYHGRVTMPYQPFVTVGGSINAYTSTTGVQPFDEILQSNTSGASAYSTSTYRFTVPVAGLYQISFNTLWQNVGSNEIALHVNGGLFARFYNSSNRTIHGTAHYNASVGDYFTLSSDAGLYLSDYANPYTSLTYRLVG